MKGQCALCLGTRIEVFGTKQIDGREAKVMRCRGCKNTWLVRPKKGKCGVCGKDEFLDCSVKDGDSPEVRMCMECFNDKRDMGIERVVRGVSEKV